MIRSVAVLGAGAVGAYLIWGLAERKDIDFCVVAEGERKERFEREGFCINQKVYFPKVKTPEEAKGVDLLVVSLKYNSLRPALGSIQTIVDEHTIVMSLMNGVDSEEIIGEVIHQENILYSYVKIASERKENRTVFDPETTVGIIYGEIDEARGTERTAAVDALFEGTGIHYRTANYILGEIWGKFRLNICNNLAQAFLGVGVGAYQDSEHAAFFQEKLGEEVDTIAKAKGLDVEFIRSCGKGSRRC
ncbi:MAG: ketopantoate reductase family protein [Acetatifactor sp.]|nr:ketopantoate reductase family protein [Acetatifactor sp.]